MAVFRSAPIYAEGKKIAEIESGDYDIDSGDEQVNLTDGVDYTNGQITTKMTCNVIVPVSGMTTRLVSYLVQKQPVLIGIFVDGQMHQVTMRPMRANYKTDSKSGKLTGSFEFNGGAPELTG